jgi:hypothetical protein
VVGLAETMSERKLADRDSRPALDIRLIPILNGPPA